MNVSINRARSLLPGNGVKAISDREHESEDEAAGGRADAR